MYPPLILGFNWTEELDILLRKIEEETDEDFEKLPSPFEDENKVDI